MKKSKEERKQELEQRRDINKQTNEVLRRAKSYLNILVSKIATSTFDAEIKTAEMLKVENASNEFVNKLSSMLGELEMRMIINVMTDEQKEELKKLLK